MIGSKSLLATVFVVLSAGGSAWAQDSAAPDAQTYPEVCRQAEDAHAGHGASTAGTGMAGMDESSMNEHQRASMPGMMQMNENMMQGMMKDDADVAFACGMIAHHQGAIDMARVELEYGDDQQMKQLAQKIIADQQREIAEMTQWLAQNAE